MEAPERTERKKIIAKWSYYLKLVEAKGIQNLTSKQLKHYEEYKQEAESIGWHQKERISASESIQRNKTASLNYYHRMRENPEWKQKYNERQKSYYHKRKANNSQSSNNSSTTSENSENEN